MFRSVHEGDLMIVILMLYDCVCAGRGAALSSRDSQAVDRPYL